MLERVVATPKLCFQVLVSTELYSVMDVCLILLWPCSFCLFCQKKSVNSKPFLAWTPFSPVQIFSNVTKLQRCRREVLGAHSFLSGDKILCSLTVVLRWFILFCQHDQLECLQLTFLVIRKILIVSDAKKVAKTKCWRLQNFHSAKNLS